MKRIGLKVALIALTLFQLALAAGLYVLNHLAPQRAGVYRHLYYRRRQLEFSWLSGTHRLVLTVLALVLVLGLLVLLWRLHKSGRALYLKVSAMTAAGLGGVVLWQLNSAAFQENIIWPYALLAVAIIWGLEFIKLLLGSFCK